MIWQGRDPGRVAALPFWAARENGAGGPERPRRQTASEEAATGLAIMPSKMRTRLWPAALAT